MPERLASAVALAIIGDCLLIIEASAKLLNENVPITAEPPQYIYTMLPSLRPVLLEDATEEAMARPRCSRTRRAPISETCGAST